MMQTFYYGVVESRADPLKLGRCKVRIVGIHTENTAILPTKDLPWAYPLQPITSAAMSGIGQSPTGLVEGSFVVCIFRDEGSWQEPIMLGSIGGIPEGKEQNLKDPYSGTVGTIYEGVRDIVSLDNEVDAEAKENGSTGDLAASGGTSDSSSSSPFGGSDNILIQTESFKVLKEGKKEKPLGSYSQQGARPINAINDYDGEEKEDPRGAQYGRYRLPSYMDGEGTKSNRAANSPVARFAYHGPYKEDFKGLIPATKEFDAKWQEVAARDPKGFEDAQRQHMVDHHYAPTVNQLRAEGVDLTQRGGAVQEMIFSTSTDYGSGEVIRRGLRGKDLSSLSDADLIEAVQDDKLKHVDRDFRHLSEEGRNKQRQKILKEKRDLVDMAGKESPLSEEEREGFKKKGVEVIPSSGVTKPITIAENDKSGFQDPFGLYPRKNWINEADTSRLARGEKQSQTIMRAKEQTLIKGVGTAGGGSWDEPKSPYAAQYPLNHVIQTESGHVQEWDDTPNAERIHLYHRAGSFVEFHPDGSVVLKSVKDQYDIVVKDRNVYIGGSLNITVLGDANIYSKGSLNLESDGDMAIKTGANLTIGAEGKVEIVANNDLYLGAGGNIHEGASNIMMNCSWFPQTISAGDYAVGQITVQVYDDDESVEPVAALDELESIQSLSDSGAIPPAKDYPRPIKGEGGQMVSRAVKPEPEMDQVKQQPVDKTEVPKCHGEDAKGSDMLSKNYRLADLTTSPVLSKVPLKAQAGLTKCEIFENLSELAKNVLEPIRAAYGNSFIITSAFRNYTGGKSQHPKGQAVDIQFPNLKPDEYVHRIEEIARTVGAFDQIILEYHGKNPLIHISFNPQGNRKQKLTTPNLKNYYGGFRDRAMGLVYR